MAFFNEESFVLLFFIRKCPLICLILPCLLCLKSNDAFSSTGLAGL